VKVNIFQSFYQKTGLRFFIVLYKYDIPVTFGLIVMACNSVTAAKIQYNTFVHDPVIKKYSLIIFPFYPGQITKSWNP
jgi:hypothetical protein